MSEQQQPASSENQAPVQEGKGKGKAATEASGMEEDDESSEEDSAVEEQVSRSLCYPTSNICRATLARDSS